MVSVIPTFVFFPKPEFSVQPEFLALFLSSKQCWLLFHKQFTNFNQLLRFMIRDDMLCLTGQMSEFFEISKPDITHLQLFLCSHRRKFSTKIYRNTAVVYERTKGFCYLSFRSLLNCISISRTYSKTLLKIVILFTGHKCPQYLLF